MDYSAVSRKHKLRKYRSQAGRIRNKIVLIAAQVLLAAFLIAVLGGSAAVIGAYVTVLNETPTDFEYFVIEPTKFSTKIVDSYGNEIGGFKGEEDRENVDFDDIPEHLKNAFIAIEDERFYSHNGIDVRSIVRSAREVFLNNNLQGASTITQQLIKMNITKVTRNSLESKLREQYIAIKYEEFLAEKLGGGADPELAKKAAKDYILSVYLNSIPMHHGLYGVATASRYYFGKDVSEITLSEAAVLAGITNNPSRYAPDRRPDNNRFRRDLILDKMLELEFITEAEYNEAMEDDVYARVGAYALAMEETAVTHSFYEDQIFESLLADLQSMGYDRVTATNLIYNGGLTIYSAQDFGIQKIVDDAYADDENFPLKDYEIDVLYLATLQNTVTGGIRNVENRKTVKTEEEAEEYIEAARNGNPGLNEVIQYDRYQLTPQPQSAFAVIDYHTGYVKAIAGGRGEKTANRAFNRATRATRSPGSVFKVLASYAPAIDMGLITPATVIDDAPFLVDTYAPVNWYNGFRGPCTVRQGITNSLNVITVKNMVNTGIDTCFGYLLDFGFTTLIGETDERGNTDIGPSLCLGGLTNGVTQVELAAAYGSIANGGLYNKPVFYTKVLDRYNQILIDNTPAPRRVLKETSAYLLTDMMKGVLTDSGATGGKARFSEVRMPIAGKTGTSSDTYDLVFTGYTPYYCASIWFGFDIQKPIEHASGGHMLLWSKIMEEIHRDLPYKDFERPQGIVSATVCRHSGLLPLPGVCDDSLRTEIFAQGTVPTAVCAAHLEVPMCGVSMMRANAYCPRETIEMMSVISLSGELALCDWHLADIYNPPGDFPGGLPEDLGLGDIDLDGINSSQAQEDAYREAQGMSPGLPSGLPQDLPLPNTPQGLAPDLSQPYPYEYAAPSLPDVPDYNPSESRR